MRSSAVMEVEFIPNPHASRAEKRRALKELRDRGIKVTVRGEEP